MGKARSKVLNLTLGVAGLAVFTVGAMILIPDRRQMSFAATATSTATPSGIQGIATPTPTPVPSIALPVLPIQTLGAFPLITHLESTVAQPGLLLGIDGTKFGTRSDQSVVYLEWTNVLVNNNYTQDQKLELYIEDWQDAHVEVEVPPDVEGVPDQPAHVVLTAANGLQGSADIKFTATHVVAMVAAQDADVTFTCSANSGIDTCGPDDPDEHDFAWAGHSDLFYTLGESGTDGYQVRLANGWKYASLSLVNYKDAAGFTALQDDALQVGATDLYFTVYWYFFGEDFVEYQLFLNVSGPKGVPFK